MCIRDSPWSPHFALWFYVNLEFDSILTDVPLRPKGFKDLPDGSVPPSGHITWDEAKLHHSHPYLSRDGDADGFTPSVYDRAMDHSTSMVGTDYTSRWMADTYYRWCQALEVHRLHGNTLNHPEKFMGRGLGMVVKT